MTAPPNRLAWGATPTGSWHPTCFPGAFHISAYLRELRGFGRDVRLYMLCMGLVSFALMNGIYPVLFNLYLLRLGHGPEFVGTVGSMSSLAMALFSLPAGALGMRWGLRRSMLAGVLLMALFFGLMPLAALLPRGVQDAAILAFRLGASGGVALFYVNSVPYLAGVAASNSLASIFAFQVVASQLLGLTGSLVGGALPGVLAGFMGLSLEHPAPYRSALLFSAIMALGGAWAIFRTRESHPQIRAKGRDARPATASAGSAPVLVITVLAVGAMLQTATVGVSKTFFNVYLDDQLGLSTAGIGSVFAVVQLISAVAAGIMPRMIDRWGLYVVLIGSAFAQALGIMPLALIPLWGAALLGRSTVSACASIHFPAMNMILVEAVPPRWRSAMSGAQSMAKQISWMAISIAGGYVIASMGYRALFLGAMALSLIGTLILWGFVRVRGGQSVALAMGDEAGQVGR